MTQFVLKVVQMESGTMELNVRYVTPFVLNAQLQGQMTAKSAQIHNIDLVLLD